MLARLRRRLIEQHESNFLPERPLQQRIVIASQDDKKERHVRIAAHAVTVSATLVSRDKAFGRVPDRLVVEAW